MSREATWISIDTLERDVGLEIDMRRRELFQKMSIEELLYLYCFKDDKPWVRAREIFERHGGIWYYNIMLTIWEDLHADE
jgi:hypothetical protein